MLLLFDNVGCHISEDLLLELQGENIICLTFPPNGTAQLQPLDVGVFNGFKKYYGDALSAIRLEAAAEGKKLKVQDVLPILSTPLGHLKYATCWRKGFSSDNIIYGFYKAGIYPLDRNTRAEDQVSCRVALIQARGEATTE